MFKNTVFLFAAIGLFLAPAIPAVAGECCGCDPIYDRNENGLVDTSAYVRDFPCMENSNIITTVTKGSVIKIIAETDGWYKVSLSDGTEGWVGARLMSKTSQALTSSPAPKQQQSSGESAYSLRRYKGYIFLQVQQNGEAYYYHPLDEKRYYLGRPSDAFTIMRKLSLGATHSFIHNNTYFPEHVVGRILLDVEKNGEAYYIYPKDRKKYYLGRPADAYRIMRELGLGITDDNLSKISVASI
jgi:hypothetical protein